MYEYIYELLKEEFTELVDGSKTHIYPSQAPDDAGFDDMIIFANIGNDQTFHSKMATVQISCFSKNALTSVSMCNRVRKLFQNMDITGLALFSKVQGGVDMLYEADTKYYQSNCEVLLQSTNEFVV